MTDNLEIMSQSSAPGLIRNGNFAHGLAHWHGSYAAKSSNPTSSLVPSVTQLAISRLPDELYLPTQGPGIWQYLDRPDLAQFPSSRSVTGLLFLPASRTKAILQIVVNFTAIDGKVLKDKFPQPLNLPLEDYTQDLIFQHPFVHTGLVKLKSGDVFSREQYEVRQKAGDAIPLTDARNDDNSGVYRVDRLLIDYQGLGGLGGPPTFTEENPQFDKATFHSLVVTLPVGKQLAVVADQLTEGISQLTLEVDGNILVGRISAAGTLINGLDRKQTNSTATGLLVGDVLRVEAPFAGSGRIADIVVGATETTFLVEPLLNVQGTADIADLPPLVDQEVSVWSIMPTSVANVTRTLPIYKYDFTAAITYRVDGPFVRPEAPSIEFRQLNEDDTINGFGDVVEVIPSEPSEELDVSFALSSGTQEDTRYRRLVNRIVSEYTAPVSGRAALRITAPKTGADGVSSFNVVAIEASLESLPGVGSQQAITVEVDLGSTSSFIPAELQTDQFVVLTSTPGKFLNHPWIDLWLDEGATLRILSSTIDTSGATSTVRVSGLYPPEIGDFFVAASNPWPGTAPINEAPILSVSQVETLESAITDVFLVKGDFTERVTISDDVALPPGTALNSGTTVDGLVHRVDLLDNVIPTGTIIMYAGGGVCPAGFKRVQQYTNEPANSLVAELPRPDSVTYLADSNRTRFRWNQSFPLLDDEGNPIPKPSTSDFVTEPVVGLPDVNETFEIAQFQQVVQPGMQIRYDATNITQEVLDEVSVVATPGLALQFGDGGTNGFVEIDADGMGDVPLTSKSEFVVELWFRYDGPNIPTIAESWLISSFQYDTPGNQNSAVGWGIRILANGQIEGIAKSRQGSAYRTSTMTVQVTDNWETTTAGAGSSGKWFHVAASFNGGRTGANNQGVRLVVSGDMFDMPVIASTTYSNNHAGSLLASSGNFYGVISRGPLLTGPTTNPLAAAIATPVTVDQLRMAVLTDPAQSALTSFASQLWDNGAGTPTYPSTLQQLAPLWGEYLMDNQNLAPTNTASNEFDVLGPADLGVAGQLAQQPDKVPGYVSQKLTTTVVTLDNYRSAVEDRDFSVIVTDVVTAADQSAQSIPSAQSTKDNATLDEVDGFGVVAYPSVVQVGEGSSMLQSSAPLGPGKAEQTETFGSGQVIELNINTSLLTDGVLNVGFRGSWNVSGTTGLVEFPAGTFQYIPQVGDVFWLEAYNFSRGLIVQCTYSEQVDIGTPFVPNIDRIVELRAYNGGTLDNLPVTAIGNLRLRPAKLYGSGQHQLTPNGVNVPGITQNKVQSGGNTFWSTRLLQEQTDVYVAGRAAIPPTADTLRVEASSYLRYDDPDTAMDYGAGGHSHLVLNGTGTTTGPVLPRVNEATNAGQGAVSTPDTPFTEVAALHNHGFLQTSRFPMPFAKLVTLCQRL